MIYRRAAMAVTTLAFLYFLPIANAVVKYKYSPDGMWWLSISKNEQDGFVKGYLDCYIYELKGLDKYEGRPFNSYGKLIVDFYQNNSQEKNRPVAEIMHMLRDKSGESKSLYGEEAKGAHGYFDGLYWSQMWALQGKDEQVGFVEGYITCHELRYKKNQLTLSKSPFDYVNLIDQWYGFDKKSGDMNADRQDRPIADVLLMFYSSN